METPTNAELFRGSLREVVNAAGAKASEKVQGPSPSSPMGALAQLGEMVLAARKPLVQAATYGSAALMEGAISLDPGLKNYYEIQSKLPRDDSGEIVNIELPNEPLKDNEEILDAETGKGV